jgi:hypothetical protein
MDTIKTDSATQETLVDIIRTWPYKTEFMTLEFSAFGLVPPFHGIPTYEADCARYEEACKSKDIIPYSRLELDQYVEEDDETPIFRVAFTSKLASKYSTNGRYPIKIEPLEPIRDGCASAITVEMHTGSPLKESEFNKDHIVLFRERYLDEILTRHYEVMRVYFSSNDLSQLPAILPGWKLAAAPHGIFFENHLPNTALTDWVQEFIEKRKKQ